MKDRFMGRLGGFTLIELLVVVLIIGVLTAVALPQYEKAVEKARSAQAMIFLDTFIKGQKMYYLANSEYFVGSLDDFDVTGVKLPVLQNQDWMTARTINYDSAQLIGAFRIGESGPKYILQVKLKDGVVPLRVCSGERWCKSFGITTPCALTNGVIIAYPGEEKDWCYIESGYLS